MSGRHSIKGCQVKARIRGIERHLWKMIREECSASSILSRLVFSKYPDFSIIEWNWRSINYNSKATALLRKCPSVRSQISELLPAPWWGALLEDVFTVRTQENQTLICVVYRALEIKYSIWMYPKWPWQNQYTHTPGSECWQSQAGSPQNDRL